MVSFSWGLGKVPQSGLELTVHFDAQGESFTNVYLQGDARAVYEGHILPDAWKS